jgi:hypothetical protein
MKGVPVKILLVAMCTIVLAVGAIAQEVKDGMKVENKGHAFALKELDTFHDQLHPLVHDALPAKDFATVRAALDGLHAKSIAIQKAKLPKKLASHRKDFQKQSKMLVTQLSELAKNKETMDDGTLEKKFDEMHETFEQLVQLLSR